MSSKLTFELSHPITIPSKTRVAVIGSGMAGLSAAWLLSRQGFQVTIFEKGSRPGLSAHSRDFAEFLPNATGVNGDLHGDVPSRMFNESLWPSVTRLYREAGVEFEPVDHHQTFYRGDDVLLKTNLPYSASVLKNVFNPVARRMVGSIASFQKMGIAALESGASDGMSFGEFLDRFNGDTKFDEFQNGFLIPVLTSTVFTCAKADLIEYPCNTVLEALRRITDGESPLMRTVNGSSHAAQSLLAGVEAIHFNTSVQQVTRIADAAIIHLDGQSIEFDHVIVATQANHAGAIVAEAFPEEAALLRKFRYVDVPIEVHSDSTVLPKDKRDWGTFNFDSSNPETSTCTVWMNRFHANWPDADNLFHSIFPSTSIDSTKLLLSTRMQRPVLDARSLQLLSELDALHCRDRRVWFAGSYAAAGVPLLESAVQSSIGLVDKITMSLKSVA